MRWSEAYLSAMPTLPIVDINAALFNSSGAFLGVASFSFELDELDTELKKISPMEGSAVVLLDNARKVLASSIDRDSYEKFEIGINENLTTAQTAKGCIRSDAANSATTSLVVCQYSIENFGFEPLAQLKAKHSELLAVESDSDDDESTKSSSFVHKYTLAGSSYFVSVISLKMTRVQGMHWQVVSFLPEKIVTSDIIRGRNIAIYVAISLGVFIAICVGIVVKLMLSPLSLIASRMESAAYLKVRGGGGKTVDSSSTEHASGEEDNDERLKVKALAAKEALEKERQPSYLSDIAAIQNAYWDMADELWILKGYIPEHITKGLVAKRNGMNVDPSPGSSDGDLPSTVPRATRGSSKGTPKGPNKGGSDRRSSSGRGSSGARSVVVNKNRGFSPSEMSPIKIKPGEFAAERKNSRSANGKLSDSAAEAPRLGPGGVPALIIFDSPGNGLSSTANLGLPPAGKTSSVAGAGTGFEFPTIQTPNRTNPGSFMAPESKMGSAFGDTHLEDSLALDISMGSLENVSVAANRLAGLSKVEEDVPIYFADNVLVDRDITVVHINIVSFHKYCRVTHGKQLAQEHEVIVNLLYNTAKKCGGVMDTFSGDKFYFTFNAASRCINHQIAALCFAHEVTTIITKDAIWGSKRRKVEHHCRLNNKPIPTDKFPPHVYRAAPFGVSCGVASGRAFVGPLGTEKIRRHSVLSNAISEAVALERLCMKYPACQVLIAGDFVTAIEPYFAYQLLDAAILPGTNGKRRRLASVKGPMRTSDLTIFKGGCRAMSASARDKNVYSQINDCFIAFLEGRSENCVESLKTVDVFIDEESRRLTTAPQPLPEAFSSSIKTPSNTSNAPPTSPDIPINDEECADMVIMSQFLWSLLQCEPALDGRCYRSPLGETYQPVQHALFLSGNQRPDPLDALMDDV
eukprot:GILI01005382.1.p1 GENE.GILI01005382.1~~GILI01005382.1.p1  ORF type:complete len:1006 (+),score=155.15 GILI01005382.1:269-3019(+)